MGGRIELLGSEETWPKLLESTASEWDAVEDVETCMTHNLDVKVFAKSIWDVHCGVHTVRCMFQTENVIPHMKKIREFFPGASIQSYIPKSISHKPVIKMETQSVDRDEDDEDQDENQDEKEQNKNTRDQDVELTEEEEIEKREREKDYPFSVTVKQWFDA